MVRNRGAMEDERPPNGAGEGPAIGRAPDVLAHDESLHERLAIDAVFEPAHVAVHEPQDRLVVVEDRTRAESAVARAGLHPAGVHDTAVHPGADHELRAGVWLASAGGQPPEQS